MHTDETRGRSWAAILGPVLCLAGVAGYFLAVFRYGAVLPGVRDWAVPNWIVVAAGLALSARGVRRARARGVLARVLAATSVAIAAGFAWMLYVLPALPAAAGPALGTPAPDFALAAPDGRIVRLADFRGGPLLLVFYRGHW